MKKEKEFKMISSQCVNSKWIAKFLAKKKQECCQCLFGCKIRIKYKNGYEYIISEAEYYKLKALNKIEKL